MKDQSNNELRDLEPTLDDLDDVMGGAKRDDPSLSGSTSSPSASRTREGYLEMFEMG